MVLAKNINGGDHHSPLSNTVIILNIGTDRSEQNSADPDQTAPPHGAV